MCRDVISNLPELGRYEMGMLNLFGELAEPLQAQLYGPEVVS